MCVCELAVGGSRVIVSASELLVVASCLHINSVEADRPSLPCCSFASGFQALSVALMLPGIASLRGIGWQNLPGYLVEGVPHFEHQPPTPPRIFVLHICSCTPSMMTARRLEQHFAFR
jgi:hypothetical protein